MTSRPITPSGYAAALVLHALAQGHAYGFELMRVTGLPSGTVYPLLRRLEAGGVVSSSWEDEGTATAEGRPKRREYRLTSDAEPALAEARAVLAKHRRILEGLAGGDSVPATS